MSYLNHLPPISREAQLNQAAELDLNTNLRILTEGIRKRQGKVFGYDITLTQDAMPTYIDFIDRKWNQNVPAGTPVITPGAPVYIVDLVNTGGGILKYSINLSINEGGTKTLLNGGSVRHKSGRGEYTHITMRAIGANATVNIGFEM